MPVARLMTAVALGLLLIGTSPAAAQSLGAYRQEVKAEVEAAQAAFAAAQRKGEIDSQAEVAAIQAQLHRAQTLVNSARRDIRKHRPNKARRKIETAEQLARQARQAMTKSALVSATEGAAERGEETTTRTYGNQGVTRITPPASGETELPRSGTAGSNLKRITLPAN